MAIHISSIRGEKGKKKSKPYTPREAPNTLQSKNTARIIDLISEGEIEGLINGAQSIYLDDTPIQNPDGTYNFSGIYYEERTGTPTQAPINGFPMVEHEVAVGTEVKQSQPVVRSITSPDIDAIRVKIRLPSLTHQNSKGDLNGSQVELAIDIKSGDADFIEAKRCVINGKTTSPYERSYRVELPAGGSTWQVRLRRLTPDSQKLKTQNQTYFAGYTTIIDAKLTYPDSALVGLTVNAEEFGTNVPRRSYDVRGIKIKVPANYDPETRTYQGIWNGVFKVAWSNNPAWILYDLLTNDRYGLGNSINPAAVDKWELYTIGQYCDELVNDGFGSEEPRFTLNTVINSRKEAYEVIKAVSSAFRGMCYWSSGAVTPVQDRPGDPVKLVSPANVIDGEFNYTGTQLKSRKSTVLVTWNDPKNDYNSTVEVVEDSELTKKYGWTQADVAAFGCTSRGQAHRLGRWILDSAKHETETVTYRASFDHADVRPGDIISVADPGYAGARYGGRIVSVVDQTVTIDSPVELKGGEEYQLSVVLPSGDIETRQINTTNETTIKLTIAEPFSEAPKHAAMWVLSASDLKPRTFRVISLSESEKNIFEISALLHDPNKYDRVEKDLHFDEPDYYTRPLDNIASVAGMNIHEYLYRSGASVLSAITLSWEPSTSPRVRFYDVQMKKPSDIDFINIATTSAPSVDIPNTTEGEYSFRVRALDGFGIAGPWTQITRNILAMSAPPSDVEGFSIRVVGSNAQLSWQAVPDLDLSHYHIKFTPTKTGATWNDGVDLATNVVGTTLSVPAMIGTYMIKAIDFKSVESTNEAIVSSSIGTIEGLNVVESIKESPVFVGNKERCTIVNGVLQSGAVDNLSNWVSLDDISSLTYGHNGVAPESVYHGYKTLDLGDVYTSRVTALLRARGAKVTSVMSSWLTLSQLSNNLLESSTKDWSVKMQIRTTDQDPELNEWGQWLDFVVGDYTARAYQWRVILYSYNPSVAAQITQLELQIDMPDRVVGGADIACPSEGVFIPFQPAFWTRPAIAIDGQEMQPGDIKEVTDQSAHGFYVRFLDANGNGVNRSFDFIAKGYGYGQN